MKVALAQLNPTVGDIEGNAALIAENISAAARVGADLVVFPELALFGYPPKDMLNRGELVGRNVAALGKIASSCRRITAVVGYVCPDPQGRGAGNQNAAAVCARGKVQASYAKTLLPTYDVFDETRYFLAGDKTLVVDVGTGHGHKRVGITICEDLWNDHQFNGRQVYKVDPISRTVDQGAELIVNLSGSPYRAGIQENRESLFSGQVRMRGVPLVYVNQVGGNDDLLFDGASLVLGGDGKILARAKAFEEDLLVVDLQNPGGARIEAYPDRVSGIRDALVMGVGDYIAKCGFKTVVIGLSGGVDSAVTAAIAVDAVGPSNVRGVAMPSRFSSSHSVEDAKQLADNLGIRFEVIAIEGVHRAMEQTLASSFAECDSGFGVTEENIQARVRGNILMALSNKFGSLLLTTGNKSELAVGYCTLYGDMCGGLAVLSDVPKTVVYEVARLINESAGMDRIPLRTIEKEPSAELRANQCDSDTLPDYALLDGILERYVECDLGVDEIVDQGFDLSTVDRIARLVDQNEYKRKQAAVGLKVTSRAFGTGRRMPIAARHR